MRLENLKAPLRNQFERNHHLQYADPTFIPIHLTGGVGDIIMAIDALRRLSEYNIVVYTYHLDAFRFFEKDIPSAKATDSPPFKWWLEFNTTARFHFRTGFDGFLMEQHRELFKQQRNALDDDSRLESIVMTHHKQFFLIAEYARDSAIDRRQMPMHCLGFKSKIPFHITPIKLIRDKVITIHDGFDVHNRSMVSGRATKQWKWSHWNSLVRLLKQKYPDYQIIQLGTSSTARLIDGVDQNLIDKTTITEAFDILARSSWHIDGDSGLVHVATRLNTPCSVLWGPTPWQFYGYEQNQNLMSLACAGSCYGVKENWNDKCPIGYSSPRCMDEITPEAVLESINLEDKPWKLAKGNGGDTYLTPSMEMTSSSSTCLSSWVLKNHPILT